MPHNQSGGEQRIVKAICAATFLIASVISLHGHYLHNDQFSLVQFMNIIIISISAVYLLLLAFPNIYE